MIRNIFLSLALSSIGFGCYIYFIKKKSVKKIEKKEEYNEEILNEEISDEEISDEEILNEEIDDLKTPMKELTESGNLQESTESDELYESCEDDISLKDMERYQIVLYKDPFITSNNWEFIN